MICFNRILALENETDSVFTNHDDFKVFVDKFEALEIALQKIGFDTEVNYFPSCKFDVVFHSIFCTLLDFDTSRICWLLDESQCFEYTSSILGILSGVNNSALLFPGQLAFFSQGTLNLRRALQ